MRHNTQGRMTTSEKLASAIDIFRDSPKGMKACFFMTLISCFIYIVSFSSDGWAYMSKGSLMTYQGLWNHCSSSNISNNFTCCESVENFYKNKNQKIPAWFNAVRVLQSIGLCTSLASVILSVLCTSVSGTVNKREVQIAAAVLNFLTAGSILIGVSIYGGKYKYETEIENYNIFWSFIVSIIAGVSYLTTGFFYLFIDSAYVQPQEYEQHPPNQSPRQRPHPIAPSDLFQMQVAI
ncbi:uncharacterized protein LOC144620080 [Crassostrea virginica]